MNILSIERLIEISSAISDCADKNTHGFKRAILKSKNADNLLLKLYIHLSNRPINTQIAKLSLKTSSIPTIESIRAWIGFLFAIISFIVMMYSLFTINTDSRRAIFFCTVFGIAYTIFTISIVLEYTKRIKSPIIIPTVEKYDSDEELFD